MGHWERFHKCPGCGLDLASGEGERSCAWGDCPYLPVELDVWCPRCRLNMATGEGDPHCADPETCEDAAEARANVANLRRWLELQQPTG